MLCRQTENEDVPKCFYLSLKKTPFKNRNTHAMRLGRRESDGVEKNLM